MEIISSNPWTWVGHLKIFQCYDLPWCRPMISFAFIQGDATRNLSVVHSIPLLSSTLHVWSHLIRFWTANRSCSSSGIERAAWFLKRLCGTITAPSTHHVFHVLMKHLKSFVKIHSLNIRSEIAKITASQENIPLCGCYSVPTSNRVGLETYVDRSRCSFSFSSSVLTRGQSAVSLILTRRDFRRR